MGAWNMEFIKVPVSFIVSLLPWICPHQTI